MVTIAFDPTGSGASLGNIAASAVHGHVPVRFFSGNPDRPDLDDLVRHVIEHKLRGRSLSAGEYVVRAGNKFGPADSPSIGVVPRPWPRAG